jgi:ApaG protein
VLPMPQYQFTCEAQPEFLADQSDAAQSVYVFAYTLTIRNTGNVPAQLIARHWVIKDAAGHTQEVKGLGVVGQQPLLKPGESFQYTSGTRLHSATGIMRGSFFCVAEDGERFDADVQAFVLDAGTTGPASRVLH